MYTVQVVEKTIPVREPQDVRVIIGTDSSITMQVLIWGVHII